MRKKKQLVKLVKRLSTAVVLALVVAATILNNVTPISAINKLVDGDTSDLYSLSLGDNASTEYAGRIWTDKSVYKEVKSFDMYGGVKSSTDFTLADDEFLIAFSALGTSQAVTGKSKVALDVMFVIDMSNSMNQNNMGDGRTRLANMVDALNDAVESVLAINDYARIGVVAFNGESSQILPLDHYTKYTGTERVNTGSYWRPNYVDIEKTFDFFELNGTTINTHAVNSLNQNVILSTASKSGTNIQRGIAHGMSLLVNEESTFIDEGNGVIIQRVPSLILLSDGEPTSSSDKKWWEAANDAQYYNYENAVYSDNAMKVLMTAGYMKKQINENYAKDGIVNNVSVYTVGVGLEDKQGDARDLAEISVDPKTYLTVSENRMGTVAREIKNGLTAYFKGESPTVDGYKFDHPQTNDLKDVKEVYYVDRYTNVSDSDSITDAFASIVQEISVKVAEAPTEIKSGTPASESGYITYTDPIGRYMTVTGFEKILYAGNEYKDYTKQTNGNTTTYTFHGEVHSGVYGDSDLSDIIIEVTKDTSGNETVVIKVPASIIPVRVNTVNLDSEGDVLSHTNNGTFPIRVLYTVGVNPNVVENGSVKVSKIDPEYVTANTNADGTINFYTNLYTNSNEQVNENTVGDTTVEFEPAHTNPFYYLQDNLPIFDENGVHVSGYSANDLEDGKTYEIRATYYHGLHKDEEHMVAKGEQFKKTAIISINGKLYRAAGSPRLNRILEFEGTKGSTGNSFNATNTAGDFYAPTFKNKEGSTSAYDGYYKIYLGNNGLISANATGTLKISKDVVIPENSIKNESQEEFKFTVNLSVNNEFEAYHYSANGALMHTGHVSNGSVITLKDGEYIEIHHLAPGTKYTITEEVKAGYETTVNGTVSNKATGTIEAGKVSTVDYVNTYELTPVTTANLTGKKILSAPSWSDNYAFSFTITPFNNAPLPTGYDATHGVTVTTGTKVSSEKYEASFSLGAIEFTEPGTYSYIIQEKEPENNGYLPGITYSNAHYLVVYKVTDNGDGTLNVLSDIQKLYEDNGTPLFTYDANNNLVLNDTTQDAINFENEYNSGSVVRSFVGSKVYNDLTGNNPLTSGMFKFTLEPVGVQTGANSVDATQVNAVPMPIVDGNRLTSVTTENEGTSFTFLPITYEDGHIPSGQDQITYVYKITEQNLGVPGYVYDLTDVYVYVTLKHNPSTGILDVQTVYTGGAEAIFRNTFNYTNTVSVPLNGMKELIGREWNDQEEYTFELSAFNNNDFNDYVSEKGLTLSAGFNAQQKATKANKEFTFGSVTIARPGTYEFAIKETSISKDGVEVDQVVKYVTIEVYEKENAQLDYKIIYDNQEVSTVTDKAVFINTYKAEPTEVVAGLSATKKLTGKPLVSGEFFYEIFEDLNGNNILDGSEKVIAVTNTADDQANNGVYEGTIKLIDSLTFDTVGKHVYIISEETPSSSMTHAGVTYDSTMYRYTIDVTDNLVGKLIATTKLEVSEDQGVTWIETTNAIVFENSYEVSPTTIIVPEMIKAIDGTKPLEADAYEFTLTVTPTDGAAPTVVVARNDKDGLIKFENIVISKPGEYTLSVVETQEVKPGMTYDNEVATATIIVTDNGDGTLSTRYKTRWNKTIFVNKYESQGEFTLTIDKVFTGRENDEWLNTDVFEFEIVVLDPKTQEAIENGDIKLVTTLTDPIIRLTSTNKSQTTPPVQVYKEGTYEFIVREIVGTIPGVNYDGEARKVIVTAVDDGQGNIAVTYDVEDTNNRGLTFYNVYDADSTFLSGHDHFSVTKVLEGREWLETDEFTFVLAAADQKTIDAITAGKVILPTETTLKITTANKAHPHFGNIIFNAVGEYRFTITEQASNIPGVTNDPNATRTVMIHVVDDGKGNLVANVHADASDSLVFTNTYAYKPLVVDGFDVTKTLIGRDWFDSDQFEFELNAIDEETTNAINEGKVVLERTKLTLTKDKQQDSFGMVTFKEVGTYKFSIIEINGDIEGITYDRLVRYITVHVTDKDDQGNPTGQLKVTMETNDCTFEFKNTYTPTPVTTNLEVIKVLEGVRPLGINDFRFHLTAIGGAPMPSVDTIVANGNNGDVSKAQFGTITFTQAGTYQYEIEEIVGTLEGVTYDTNVITATVVVEYNPATGKLDVKEPTYSNNGTFTNKYKGQPVELIGETNLKVEKTFTGRPLDKWLDTDKFTFTIAPYNQAAIDAVAKNDIVMANTTLDIDVNNHHNAYFGNILFKEVGEYEFVITEQDSGISGVVHDLTPRYITIEVTDDGIGRLVAVKKAGSDELKFKNTYVAQGTLNLPITKVFTGREWSDTDIFKFEILILDQNTQSAVDSDLVDYPTNELIVDKKNPTVNTGEFVFRAEGTYKFIVREKNTNIPGVIYDSIPRELVIYVTDTNTGAMDVTYTISGANGLTFYNEYKTNSVELTGHTQLHVVKNFTGRDWLETDQFTFKLELVEAPAEAVDEKAVEIKNDTLIVTSANKAHSHFENIVFHVKGQYKFTISEVNNAIPGVVYDSKVHEIIVNVVDNNDGTLSVTKEIPDVVYEFNNVYNDAEVTIEKTQSVNGGTATKDMQTVVEKDKVTYYLTVENTKDGIAKDVVVTDVVPSGLILDETSISNSGVNNNGTITWSLGEMKKDDKITLSFTVTIPDVKEFEVSADGYKYWENMATVTYKNPDGDEDSDDSDKVVVREGVPVVSIKKSQQVNDGPIKNTTSEVVKDDIVTYYITVTNTGTEVAKNVVVTDVVPSGLILDETSISNGGNNNSGIITWTIPELSGEETLSFKVKVPETPDKFNVWTNIAKVQYPNDPEKPNEPEPSNPVSVINSVDGYVKADKQLIGNRTTFEDGEFTFAIDAVTEGAPMPSADVVGNVGSAAVFGPIAFNLEGEYVYAINEITPDTPVPGVTYDKSVYYVKVIVGKEVQSFESSTSTTYKILSTTYYSDEACTQEVQEVVFKNSYYNANVDIVKTQSVNGGEKTDKELIVRENDQVTYYLSVTNNGKGTANEVVVTDVVPTGLEDLIVAISNGGNYNQATKSIRWELGSLAADETIEVSFTVSVPDVKESEVDATGYKSWENMATVSYKNPDGSGGTDDSEKVVIKEGAPIVTIEKAQQVNDVPITNALSEVVKDDIVTYYITVENSGTEIAEEIVVKDKIPEGLILVDGSISNHGELNGTEITWLIDNLEVGEVDTLSFKVKVPSVTVDTQYKNIATIAYENDPEKPTNPEPSNEVVVEEGVPSLTTLKEQSLNNGAATTQTLKVIESDKVTYIITVKNTGTGAATGVVVTDKVPTGLTLIENSITNDGVYDESTQTIAWAVGRVEAGESVVVKFSVTVPEVSVDTEWTNIATVVSTNTPDDPEPSNEVVVEEGVPSLVIHKLQSVNNGVATTEKVTVKANDTIVYTIKVANNGTETAKEITVTDKVPTGLIYVENSATQNGIYSSATDSIAWLVDELEVGQEVVLQFTVKVPMVEEDTVWTNVATVVFGNNPEGDEETPSNPVESEEKPEKVHVNTGDDNNIALLAGAFAVASIGLVSIVVMKKKDDKE